MGSRTVALTEAQYDEILATMVKGFTGFRPNRRVAIALVLEGNLGLRISDIVKLRLSDIVWDGAQYRLDITEQKTKKKRTFNVQNDIYKLIADYCIDNGIGRNEIMFPITTRAVQKQLKLVCDYLGYEDISTHSFRKFCATRIYNNSGHDIELTSQFLQHSSVAVTQRYIGVSSAKMTAAINSITRIPSLK